ncbi:hypothetical protein KKA02_02295 [Patescibacteria group bacterium]|nr:hypothetical protein [Patescibacteria group bacterium]
MTKRVVRIIEVDGRQTTAWVERARKTLRATGPGEEHRLRGRVGVLMLAENQLANALDKLDERGVVRARGVS